MSQETEEEKRRKQEIQAQIQDFLVRVFTSPSWMKDFVGTMLILVEKEPNGTLSFSLTNPKSYREMNNPEDTGNPVAEDSKPEVSYGVSVTLKVSEERESTSKDYSKNYDRKHEEEDKRKRREYLLEHVFRNDQEIDNFFQMELNALKYSFETMRESRKVD
jgi:hypothetical protein